MLEALDELDNIRDGVVTVLPDTEPVAVKFVNVTVLGNPVVS